MRVSAEQRAARAAALSALGRLLQEIWEEEESGPLPAVVKCTRQLHAALVILASLKTLGHSPKARFVVTMIEVRS
jgi:hypothetical protein